MRINCLLCGVGGQGTVLASRIMAQAAIKKGDPARTAETIGMAQRGGCVVSHVRIGEGITSPLIPPGEADVLIGFEPGEAVRCLPYLKPEGLLVVSDRPVQPVTASLGGAAYDGEKMLAYLKDNVKSLIVLSADALEAECGSGKVLNVALMGAAVASGKLTLTLEQVESALMEKLPERFIDLNKRALAFGAAVAKEETL